MTELTIPDENTEVEYAPSVSTSQFTIPFRYFNEADVKVSVNDGSGNISNYTLNTDFTVSGVAVEGGFIGGTITLTTPINTPQLIKIYRDIQISRSTNYPLTGPFDIEELNNELNKLTAISQNLLNQVQNHFISLPDNEFAGDTPWDFGARPAGNATMRTTPIAGDLIEYAWALGNLGGLLTEASVAELDALTATDRYISPRRLSDSEEMRVEEGTFEPSFNGFSTPPPALTSNVRWRRFGQFCMLEFEIEEGTSDANVFEITNLPDAARPNQDQVLLLPSAVDNGAYSTSQITCLVQNGPTVAFGRGVSNHEGGGWTASGSKGLRLATDSFLVSIIYRMD